jgi:hypothetical protein
MNRTFLIGAKLSLISYALFALAACGGGGGGGGDGGGGGTAPSALTYTSPVTATVGTALAALSPTVTGTVSSYSVSPALPAGLSLNTVTGVISGTPTATAAQATYTITASNASGMTSAPVTLTVIAIPIASVRVTLATPLLTPGQTVQAQATPLDSSGNSLSGRTVTWSSLAPSVATVSADGVVTAVGAGSSIISATSEGKTGTAAFAVQIAPVSVMNPVIEISPSVYPGRSDLTVAAVLR